LIVSDDMQMRFSADYFASEGFQNYATISPGSPSNIKNGMGTDTVKNTNVRLQNYFKASPDTNGFFRMGYSTMADLSNNYAIATNLIQTTDVAGGTTTKLDVDKKAQVNVYYQNTNFYKQTANNLTTAPYKPYINANYTDPYSTLGASAQYTHDLNAAGIDQYILGVDARNISASNQTNNLAPSSAVTSINYAQGQQNFYGLLGQLKSKANTIPLEATLGARVDAWNSQTPTYYNQNTGSAPTYQAIANKSKTQLSPSLGLLYKATADLDLRGAAYQAFHAPSMNNTLRSYGSSVGGWYLANPNLTPETMTGYELGTDYRWKGGFAQFTAFNNYINNAITSYKITSANAAFANSLCGASGITGCVANVGGSGYTNVNYYTNQQNLLSRGIEVQYHHDVNPNWALDGGYSYTRTVLTWSATSDPINTQVGGVPKNMASAGVTYYPVPQASITTTVRYVGNSWMSTGSLPVPAYAVIGLKANYQINSQASVFASVVNLLNRQYVTFNIASQASAYQAGMPQAFTVGARINF